MIHAYDNSGKIVGFCMDSVNSPQALAWEAKGYQIATVANYVDISQFKYVNGVLTQMKQEDIEKDPDVIARKRLEQLKALKNTMRLAIEAAIGDYGDNIADVTRALVLAEAIRSGAITDKKIIDGYTQYCMAMVQMYGGAEAILDVLNFDLQGLQTYLAPYYTDKAEINK